MRGPASTRPRLAARPWRGIGAGLALALTAACGSTVQVSGQETVGAGDGLGAAGAGTGTGANGSSAAGGPVATAAGSNGDGAAGTGQQPGTSESTTTQGPRVGTAVLPTAQNAGISSGRGFTKTVIYVGVATANDYNTFAGSTGLKGVGYNGNPSIWFQALADDINRHGGLFGRKVQLVAHDYSTAQELDDPASANQAACTTWTQDTPVYAVLLAGFEVEDTLLSCLANADTPLIQVGAGLDYPLHYQQSYTRYPLYFDLAQMEGSQYDRIAIGRLFARHFFDPWNTVTGGPGAATEQTMVGLIGFNDTDGARQLASWQLQLGRYGIKSTSVACPRSLSQKVACEQSTVLQFASAGVTHVFGADSTFISNANTQKYYPRYFIAVEPAIFAANASAKELNGAMSEDYIPIDDVPSDKYPGDPTAATARCRQLMKAAGQSYTDATTLVLQFSVCDEFTFFAEAVADGKALGPSALRAGMEALGSTAQSALTWKSFLGPATHASAEVLRDLSYDATLQNFVYASSTDYGDG